MNEQSDTPETDELEGGDGIGKGGAKSMLQRKTPKEEDFENIKLVSNGAYG